MADETRERLGDYELLKLIGDGAQGRVYKARCVADHNAHVPQGEIVAMKVLRITGDDDKLRQRFQHQADILRGLSHPNIVRYRDCFTWHSGEWDEAQCLVMEFLDGESLAERLKLMPAGLPWPQVQEIFEACLTGLIHARERGITHRDLKPSNVFLTREGGVRLIDFDIARRDESGQASTAGWKGTFDYMAPDFIAVPGFRGDEVSDAFSLGVCIYQALTGALPFEPLGDSAHIGYLNRWREGARNEPHFKPGAFRVLANAKAFCAKALAAQRKDRYPSFGAMQEDFRKIHYRRIKHRGKDEYELLSVLGRGGFGEVFKARRVSDGLLVAVKHLFSAKQSQRFIKESKILQSYAHPNLVKYVDFVVVEGAAQEDQYFLILEHLDGMPGWTLRNRIKHEGALPVEECIRLFRGYLDALHFLHTNPKPIIHRDIKPGNLYAPAGQPEKGKIFDLGVARDIAGTVTAGAIPGTLDYMPPEFVEIGGDRGSPQSDIYALGLCLYESLTGRPVYERLPTDVNSAWLAFRERAQRPPAVAFDAPVFEQHPRLRSIVTRALAEKPAARYPSAQAMSAELERVLRGEPEEAADARDETVGTWALPGEALSVEGAPGQATQGTRPVEALVEEGTVVAPESLLAAGRQLARRQRRRRVLALSGVAAGGVALVLLLVAGGVTLGRRWSADAARRSEAEIRSAEQSARDLPALAATEACAENLSGLLERLDGVGRKYPQAQDRLAPAATRVRQLGGQLPETFRKAFDAAVQEGKPLEARRVLTAWQASRSACAALGVPVAEQDGAQTRMAAGLERMEAEAEAADLGRSRPAPIRSAADIISAEKYALRIEQLESRSWGDAPAADKARRLADLTGPLGSNVVRYIGLRRDAAVAAYQAGQDAASDYDALRSLAASAPTLAALAPAAYSNALGAVDAARRSRTAQQSAEAIYAQAAGGTNAEQLRAAAEALAAAEKKDGGLPADQRKRIEGAISARYDAFADALGKQARAEYAAGRMAEGQKTERQLAELVAAIPERFGRAAAARTNDVAAARRDAMARQAQTAAARRKEIDDAGRRLGEFRARLAKCRPADWLDGLALLASPGSAALSDPGFSNLLADVTADLVAVVEAALAPREPLDQRLQRLEAVERLLADPQADRVFGGRAVTLREQLAQQRASFVLRVVNRTAASIELAGVGIKDKTAVESGGQKSFSVPAGGERRKATLTASAAGYKPRQEEVDVVGGGAREVVVAALEREPEKKRETVAPPAAATPTEAASAVASPPATTNASPAVAGGRGTFVIVVSPRGGVVSVDGNAVEGDALDVTADENHKVQVELTGYKSFQQYYCVKDGETRRIDILLEKSAKKWWW